MSNIDSKSEAAVIRPFEYKDEVTGDKITVSVSPQYSKITVNDREYFFIRGTGEFDGAATIEERYGLTLVYGAE
jgi:hypothetical protein